MPLRPCLGLPDQPCGRLTPASRCPDCRRATQHRHTQAKRAKRPERTRAERTRRADAVARHREAYGDWCPGWQRPPHPAADLTADHLYAVANGGDEAQPLGVLCRSCNGAKGSKV